MSDETSLILLFCHQTVMTLAGNMYSGRIYFPVSHSLRLHRKLVSSDSRSLPSLPVVCMCSGQSSDGLRVGYKAPPQSPLFSKIQPLPLKYHSSHSLPKLHSLLCGKLLLRQHAIFFAYLSSRFQSQKSPEAQPFVAQKSFVVSKSLALTRLDFQKCLAHRSFTISFQNSIDFLFLSYIFVPSTKC